MKWTWAALAIAFGLFAAIGVTTTIPVGVRAQEVREQIESTQKTNPQASLDQAVATATQYLASEQRRRVKFVFLAYLAIWAILGGYMVSLGRRQARLREEIERLRARAE